MRNILITGGAGFIGSNFIVHILGKYPEYNIINFDLLTYAGNEDNLEEVLNHPNYIFEKGDISCRDTVSNIFLKYKITDVINFAAESHVDNSISGPEAFVKTNVNGTFILLDVARNFWQDSPFKYKNEFSNSRFLHISTDEVYGTLGEEGLFTETTPYAPNSPYSASKASSDMLVRSYFHTYGLNVVTTNCSNNYGPKQHDEKLIPTIIRNALAGNKIPIYGDGKNIRDWLYVLDHCTGILKAFHQGLAGETYNIGGKNERTNNQIADAICRILDDKLPLKSGSYSDLISYVEDRHGHDKRYAIDASKIENDLGWKAEENFDSGIIKTIDWYIKKYN
ncbi:dTDP-glucose 4,6-dehydratase [Halobacteriovorax sp. DPLXC-1]|uniref:dTDP-glucose 4,6-dehydratase n=1 Tax=Halobacteriovorax sp. DPLXC-1 TaxID=3110771 RepID=UPI002FEF1543